jgi:predicted amidohydrolase YtcJ
VSAVRLFKGGEIASDASAQLQRGDVLLEDGRIKRVGANIDAPVGCEVVDCKGKIILPALFDVHVHAREPPQLCLHGRHQTIQRPALPRHPGVKQCRHLLPVAKRSRHQVGEAPRF